MDERPTDRNAVRKVEQLILSHEKRNSLTEGNTLLLIVQIEPFFTLDCVASQ